MSECRDGLAVNGAVGEHTLVDAVIIPGVMRSHLIRPRSHSGVRVTGEDGHGPFVVTRPLGGIPRPRVSASVVKQVEIRIVGIPAPGGTAAEFPLIVAPSLETGILTHWLLGCPIH